MDFAFSPAVVTDDVTVLLVIVDVDATVSMHNVWVNGVGTGDLQCPQKLGFTVKNREEQFSHALWEDIQAPGKSFGVESPATAESLASCGIVGEVTSPNETLRSACPFC